MSRVKYGPSTPWLSLLRNARSDLKSLVPRVAFQTKKTNTQKRRRIKIATFMVKLWMGACRGGPKIELESTSLASFGQKGVGLQSSEFYISRISLKVLFAASILGLFPSSLYTHIGEGSRELLKVCNLRDVFAMHIAEQESCF
jgi:hypothetical protein